MLAPIVVLTVECPEGQTDQLGQCVCEDENAEVSGGSCRCKSGFFALNGSCTQCPEGSTGDSGSCKCADGQEFHPESGVCVCTEPSRVFLNGKCVTCGETLYDATGRCVCKDRLFDWYADQNCKTLLECDFEMEFVNASGLCERCEDGAHGGKDHVSCECPTGQKYDGASKTCADIGCEAGQYLTTEGVCAPCPANSQFDAETGSCVCNESKSLVFVKDACLCAEDLVLDQKSGTCVSCPAGTAKVGDGCDCGTVFQGAVYVPETNVCGCVDDSYLNTTAGRCEKCPDGTSPSVDFASCACPADQQFVSGRCTTECAGKVGEDGLCRDSGVPVAVIVVACVGALGVIVATILCCKARRKSAARQATPLKPKEPVLAVNPVVQSFATSETHSRETQQDKQPETLLIGLGPAEFQMRTSPHTDYRHEHRRRHRDQLKHQSETAGLTPVKPGDALE